MCWIDGWLVGWLVGWLFGWSITVRHLPSFITHRAVTTIMDRPPSVFIRTVHHPSPFLHQRPFIIRDL
jgi:hypothetical protein